MTLKPLTVDVDGISTRYFEAGSGEPLVLVHGGHYGTLYNARDWSLNIEDLATTFHVYAPDKLGTGHTDNPRTDAEYVMDATVQHLYGFMRALNLDGVHLAGHSRGGYAVTRLALEHPDEVKTVTIVASGTLMRAPNPIYDSWNAKADSIADPRERIRYLKSVSSYVDSHITDEFIDQILEIENLTKTRDARAKMDGGLFAAFKRDLADCQAQTQEWISRGGLKCPVHIIWGYNDPSATIGDCGVPAMHLLFPAAEHAELSVLNRAAHYCFRDQPEAFRDRLTNFIMRS